MTTHDLKCWSEQYDAILSGAKRFEIRREDNRRFEVMDTLLLRDYDPEAKTYSGRSISAAVLYLVRGPEWGIPEGMVVMSLGDRIPSLLKGPEF